MTRCLVSGQLSTTGRLEEQPPRCWFPVAFRRTGIRFLGIRYPPGNWAFLTVGLPTHHHRRVGPCRGSMLHTRKTRLGLGALCAPGTTVSTRPQIFYDRRLPHHNGNVPTCPAQRSDPVGLTRFDGHPRSVGL
jgi:hypothetical protein